MRENKIQKHHLNRNAYIYIRQSTLKQISENTESTKRQYNLKSRAIALGWAENNVVVIDEDLGISGSGKVDRSGFKQLMMEVSMGNAGTVIGLEISRLSRNSSDWHRLLEICVLSKTLIIDEDGIYDAGHFNDRLLLGLKGTMSEAELHIIRSRMQGGILNKAKRGELQLNLPIGFVYDSQKKVVLDPDNQTRSCIKKFFQVFAEEQSAFKTVQYFNHNGIGFPKKVSLCRNSDVIYGSLSHYQAIRILKNPRYAGAFFYGRTQVVLKEGKLRQINRQDDEYHTLILDAHKGYISWKQFKINKAILARNAQLIAKNQTNTPAREGVALIQGIIICGKCGRKMTVRYQTRNGRINQSYRCISNKKDFAKSDCQIIPGTAIDRLINDLILKIITPKSIELAYSIQENLVKKYNEIEKAFLKQVERAQYDVHLAQQRFMRVDPANRLVADNLETDWNMKLRILDEEKEKLAQHRKNTKKKLEITGKQELNRLVSNFKEIWTNPNVPHREKKRIIRYVIEDVTLLRTNESIEVHIRYKGGKNESHKLPLPKNPFIELKTPEHIVKIIDSLLNKYSEIEIASYLNEKGYLTGAGKSFTRQTICQIEKSNQLKNYRDRLLEMGYKTARELANKYNVDINKFKKLREQGKIQFKNYHNGGILYRLKDTTVLF